VCKSQATRVNLCFFLVGVNAAITRPDSSSRLCVLLRFVICYVSPNTISSSLSSACRCQHRHYAARRLMASLCVSTFFSFSAYSHYHTTQNTQLFLFVPGFNCPSLVGVNAAITRPDVASRLCVFLPVSSFFLRILHIIHLTPQKYCYVSGSNFPLLRYKQQQTRTA